MNPSDILRHMGADIVSENDRYVNFTCFECGKPKAHMFVDRWPYPVKCFARGEHLATTLPGLYADVKGVNYYEAKKQLMVALKMRHIPAYEEGKNAVLEEVTKGGIPEGWKRIEKTDKIRHVTYLKNRGFNWHLVKKMHVMWKPDNDFVLFPIEERGKVVSYEQRCILSEKEWIYSWRYRKTMAPKGVRNSHFVYGIDHIRPGERIVLCEGIPNWFSLVQAGFNAGALFGSSPTERQMRIIISREPTEIIMAFDGDLAGIKGIEKARKLIQQHSDIKVESWVVDANGGDINDIHDPKALWKSFANRRNETLNAVIKASVKKKFV